MVLSVAGNRPGTRPGVSIDRRGTCAPSMGAILEVKVLP